jgi:hypothetical protein
VATKRAKIPITLRNCSPFSKMGREDTFQDGTHARSGDWAIHQSV